MLNFETSLFQNYTKVELEAISSYTQKITWGPFGVYDYHCKVLFPLAFLNPDKPFQAIRVYKTAITSTDAANEYYMSNLCDPATKHPELTVITCKRGWTFIQPYLIIKEYTYLDRISLYLQTSARHRIKAFKKDKHVVIITNIDDSDVEAKIFSALPLLYKTEFNWTDEVINYFKMAGDTKESAQACEKLYIEFVKSTKILANIKYQQLEKIIEKTSNYTIDYHKELEKQITNHIQEYELKLEELYTNLTKEQAFVAFYKPKDNLEEITKYIFNNPYIVDYYSPKDHLLVLAIEAPLEYIDVPAFKQLLKTPSSYLYPKWSGESNSYSELTKGHPIQFVEMIKDLFLSSRYKIYTRSEIILDLRDKKAMPLRKSDTEFRNRPAAWELNNRFVKNKERSIIPHMHIEYYDCWAGNKTNITKALNKNDLIGAIDICVNTTKDINVNDSAVFGRFIKDVLITPKEFATGCMPRSACSFHGIPGAEYKTIWDNEKKCFRTFLDIFINDYLKNLATQADFDIDFTDYLL